LRAPEKNAYPVRHLTEEEAAGLRPGDVVDHKS
jgi:hypothetical protein